MLKNIDLKCIPAELHWNWFYFSWVCFRMWTVKMLLSQKTSFGCFFNSTFLNWGNTSHTDVSSAWAVQTLIWIPSVPSEEIQVLTNPTGIYCPWLPLEQLPHTQEVPWVRTGEISLLGIAEFSIWKQRLKDQRELNRDCRSALLNLALKLRPSCNVCLNPSGKEASKIGQGAAWALMVKKPHKTDIEQW